MALAETFSEQPLNLFRYRPTSPTPDATPETVSDALEDAGRAIRDLNKALRVAIKIFTTSAVSWLSRRVVHSLASAWLLAASGWGATACFLGFWLVR